MEKREKEGKEKTVVNGAMKESTPHKNDMTNTPTKRKVTNVKERQTQGSN